MPFISDEIYFSNISHGKYLDQVKWPEKINIKFKNSNIDNIDSAIGLVTKLRNIKASLKVEPKATLILFVNKDLISKFINKETELLVNRLAKVKITYTNFKKKKEMKIFLSFYIKIFHLIFCIKIQIIFQKLKARIYHF